LGFTRLHATPLTSSVVLKSISILEILTVNIRLWNMKYPFVAMDTYIFIRWIHNTEDSGHYARFCAE
jgi:hypothetical protein